MEKKGLLNLMNKQEISCPVLWPDCSQNYCYLCNGQGYISEDQPEFRIAKKLTKYKYISSFLRFMIFASIICMLI